LASKRRKHRILTVKVLNGNDLPRFDPKTKPRFDPKTKPRFDPKTKPRFDPKTKPEDQAVPDTGSE
jgi:hypothetical protein